MTITAAVSVKDVLTAFAARSATAATLGVGYLEGWFAEHRDAALGWITAETIQAKLAD
jgi:hypothetical protein